MCERRLGRTVVRPALLPVKTAQFTLFFRQVCRHTVKSLNLTEHVQGAKGSGCTSILRKDDTENYASKRAWLRCCATNRKVTGSIPAGVIGIFHWHKILPIALWPWGRFSL